MRRQTTGPSRLLGTKVTSAAAALVLLGIAGCGGGTERRPAGATADAARHPCQLITKREASSVLHAAIADPHEAPLGPTCILEAKSGAVMATIAVENIAFDQVRPRVTALVASSAAGRSTYCGTLGQPTLWAPLAPASALVIVAPCSQAQALASLALSRLVKGA